MPYSREDAIPSFTSFYTFLTELAYIPPSAVLHPPATGWPSIDDIVFSPLGKNHRVLDLLRYLPYLDGEDWNIAYDTKVIPYNSSRVEQHLKNRDSLENSGLMPFGCEPLPEHVVPLTCGGNYGSWLMCDTNQGLYHTRAPLFYRCLSSKLFLADRLPLLSKVRSRNMCLSAPQPPMVVTGKTSPRCQLWISWRIGSKNL